MGLFATVELLGNKNLIWSGVIVYILTKQKKNADEYPHVNILEQVDYSSPR